MTEEYSFDYIIFPTTTQEQQLRPVVSLPFKYLDKEVSIIGGFAVDSRGWKKPIYVKIGQLEFQIESVKNPDAQRWEKFKETRWFKVVPKWVRYSDLNKWPWKVIEIEFDQL